MEADLRHRVDRAEQQGHLRHVRVPQREELQRQSLQVSLLEGGGVASVMGLWL